MSPYVADGYVCTAEGRRLAYAEWGDPSGVPVLFFHGTPGSRLLIPARQVMARGGVRLITCDRPGYGLSDPQPKRRLSDWPQDVGALADALGFSQFAVVGASGGGPHALACAAVLPTRVRAAAVVSGPAPPFVLPGGLDRMDEEDRGLIDLALRDLDAVRERMEARGDWIRDLVANPSRLTVNTEVEADRRILGDPAIHDLVIRSLREALRQGMEGYARDWLAIRLPWSFAVNEIQTRIEIWHGALDRNVPVEDAEFLAAAIPGAKLTIWPGAGHWAIFPHWEEILSALVA